MKIFIHILLLIILGCSPSLKHSKAYINTEYSPDYKPKRFLINSVSPDDIEFFSEKYFINTSNPKDMLSDNINKYLEAFFKEKLSSKIVFINTNSTYRENLKIRRIIHEDKIEWLISILENETNSLGLFIKKIKFRKIAKLTEYNTGTFAEVGQIQSTELVRESDYSIQFDYIIWDYEAKNSIAYGRGDFIYKPLVRFYGDHFEGKNVWYKQLKKIPYFIHKNSPLTESFNKGIIEYSTDIDPITGNYKDEEGELEETLEEPEEEME